MYDDCDGDFDLIAERMSKGRDPVRWKDGIGDHSATDGEDFAKVAGEISQDPSAKDNGGDLGYFYAFRMLYDFENAAYKYVLINLHIMHSVVTFLYVLAHMNNILLYIPHNANIYA